MSQAAIADQIAQSLAEAGLLEAGEVIAHAVVVVATSRFTESGQLITRTSRLHPTGELPHYIETGLLNTALTDLAYERHSSRG